VQWTTELFSRAKPPREILPETRADWAARAKLALHAWTIRSARTGGGRNVRCQRGIGALAICSGPRRKLRSRLRCLANEAQKRHQNRSAQHGLTPELRGP